jgi:hypothetical protein
VSDVEKALETVKTIKEALERGCIVFVGSYRVTDVDLVKGKKGADVMVIKTTSGLNIMVYVSRLSNYKVTVICNEQRQQ